MAMCRISIDIVKDYTARMADIPSLTQRSFKGRDKLSLLVRSVEGDALNSTTFIHGISKSRNGSYMYPDTSGRHEDSVTYPEQPLLNTELVRTIQVQTLGRALIICIKSLRQAQQQIKEYHSTQNLQVDIESSSKKTKDELRDVLFRREMSALLSNLCFRSLCDGLNFISASFIWQDEALLPFVDFIRRATLELITLGSAMTKNKLQALELIEKELQLVKTSLRPPLSSSAIVNKLIDDIVDEDGGINRSISIPYRYKYDDNTSYKSNLFKIDELHNKNAGDGSVSILDTGMIDDIEVNLYLNKPDIQRKHLNSSLIEDITNKKNIDNIIKYLNQLMSLYSKAPIPLILEYCNWCLKFGKYDDCFDKLNSLAYTLPYNEDYLIVGNAGLIAILVWKQRFIFSIKKMNISINKEFTILCNKYSIDFSSSVKEPFKKRKLNPESKSINKSNINKRWNSIFFEVMNDMDSFIHTTVDSQVKDCLYSRYKLLGINSILNINSAIFLALYSSEGLSEEDAIAINRVNSQLLKNVLVFLSIKSVLNKNEQECKYIDELSSRYLNISIRRLKNALKIHKGYEDYVEMMINILNIKRNIDVIINRVESNDITNTLRDSIDDVDDNIWLSGFENIVLANNISNAHLRKYPNSSIGYLKCFEAINVHMISLDIDRNIEYFETNEVPLVLTDFMESLHKYLTKNPKADIIFYIPLVKFFLIQSNGNKTKSTINIIKLIELLALRIESTFTIKNKCLHCDGDLFIWLVLTKLIILSTTSTRYLGIIYPEDNAENDIDDELHSIKVASYNLWKDRKRWWKDCMFKPNIISPDFKSKLKEDLSKEFDLNSVEIMESDIDGLFKQSALYSGCKYCPVCTLLPKSETEYEKKVNEMNQQLNFIKSVFYIYFIQSDYHTIIDIKTSYKSLLICNNSNIGVDKNIIINSSPSIEEIIRNFAKSRNDNQLKIDIDEVVDIIMD